MHHVRVHLGCQAELSARCLQSIAKLVPFALRSMQGQGCALLLLPRGAEGSGVAAVDAESPEVRLPEGSCAW